MKTTDNTPSINALCSLTSYLSSKFKSIIPKEIRFKIAYQQTIKLDKAKEHRLLNDLSLLQKIDNQYVECETFDDFYTFSHTHFDLLQRKCEIFDFIEFVNSQSSRRILEIGTWGGGTNFLFSQCCTSVTDIIGVDLYIQNQYLLNHFSNQKGINSKYICGDSKSKKVLNQIRSIVSSSKLDGCLIDGDHTYMGVKKDFEIYKDFVKPGGWIGFHDITPVRSSTSHVSTGDVPRYWREIKDKFKDKYEFIDVLNNDGGFGLAAVII